MSDWWDNGVYYVGELFGEDCIYETTEEQVIQEEIEKLFQLLGLELGDRENGYMIDRMEVQEDNRIEVWIKRYIEGKQLSLAAPPCSEDISKDLKPLEDIVLEFGNNQIIDMQFFWMVENPKVEDYEEEILVDSPEKAYKLLVNYIGSNVGTGEISMDAVRIAYQPVQKEGNLYTLNPQVEFYTDPSTEFGAIWKIYQLNLTTKEIRE